MVVGAAVIVRYRSMRIEPHACGAHQVMVSKRLGEVGSARTQGLADGTEHAPDPLKSGLLVITMGIVQADPWLPGAVPARPIKGDAVVCVRQLLHMRIKLKLVPGTLPNDFIQFGRP